jgi:hypothetical protein
MDSTVVNLSVLPQSLMIYKILLLLPVDYQYFYDQNVKNNLK